MNYGDSNHRKVAIMQPYFFPYLGYFQLIGAVDQFIVYDNLKYTKKGWINRNRLLVNGKAATFTLPLKRAPHSLLIKERLLATEYSRKKLLNKIYGNYSQAPFFDHTFEVAKKIINYADGNLFFYVLNSIKELCTYLEISTNIQVASDMPIDHTLKGKDKVIAICETLSSNFYINPISGKIIYDRETFIKKGIDLKFLAMGETVYEQFNNRFVTSLSIIDVLMFNSIEKVKELIVSNYCLTD